MRTVDIGPVPLSDRTQSGVDLFLIFVGANIVATTMQVGASLGGSFEAGSAMAVIGAGSVAGAALVAALAPLGPRLGVPSIIATRAVLGIRGAGLVAMVLYVTNFAWIAINNVIAASACARLVGGPDAERWWAAGLGLLATAVVAGGPRAVGLADRFAVPMMVAAGSVMTVASLRAATGPVAPAAVGQMSWIRGLDVVAGYQASWLLMFADYSRYTRSPGRAGLAVFLGLALTSAWLMPVGFLAARAAGSSSPGAMLAAVGLGGWGALLLGLGTLTTNFVNIYLSSLAWKSLMPRAGDQLSVWSIGVVGATLSLFSTVWLDRYADFVLILGGVLVPVGGILLAHYLVMRRETNVAALYDPDGPYGRGRGVRLPGLVAWAIGGAAYYLAAPGGSTLPALAAAMVTYWWLSRYDPPRGARDPKP